MDDDIILELIGGIVVLVLMFLGIWAVRFALYYLVIAGLAYLTGAVLPDWAFWVLLAIAFVSNLEYFYRMVHR